jgi:hypothetical protein
MIWFSAAVSEEIYAMTCCSEDLLLKDLACLVVFGLWSSQYPMLPSLFFWGHLIHVWRLASGSRVGREMRAADEKGFFANAKAQTVRNEIAPISMHWRKRVADAHLLRLIVSSRVQIQTLLGMMEGGRRYPKEGKGW